MAVWLELCKGDAHAAARRAVRARRSKYLPAKAPVAAREQAGILRGTHIYNGSKLERSGLPRKVGALARPLHHPDEFLHDGSTFMLSPCWMNCCRILSNNNH